MADRYLLESGSPDGYLLEDGTGVYLLDLPAQIALTDNFDDNSTSGSWTTGAPLLSGSVGGTVAETNQRVEVTPPSSTVGNNYNGYTSATTYDLRGTRTFVKVSNVAGMSGNEDVFFAFGVNASNICSFLIEGSTLLVHTLIAGGSANPFNTTYSSSTHAWLALRVSTDGSTVYIETAPSTASDSPVEGDWSVLYTLAADASWTVTTAKVGFGAGTFASTASPNVIQFDGFNIATTTGGATVAPSVGHLAFGGKVPSLTLALNPATGHLAFGGKVPTVSVGTSVTPFAGHLAFTGYQSAITRTTAVAPTVGHLAFGGKVPSVTRTTALSPASARLTFGGKVSSVSIGTSVSPLVGHLTFGAHIPALTFTTALSPTTGHLSFGGKIASVARITNLTPTLGHLAFSGKASSLSLGITPATGHLVFTGYVPDVSGAVVASSAQPLKVMYRHRSRNA